jgi:hypothetical protein
MAYTFQPASKPVLVVAHIRWHVESGIIQIVPVLSNVLSADGMKLLVSCTVPLQIASQTLF